MKYPASLLAFCAILCGCASLPHDAELTSSQTNTVSAAYEGHCGSVVYVGTCPEMFRDATQGVCALAYHRGRSFRDPSATFDLLSLTNGRVTVLGRYAGNASADYLLEFIQFASDDCRFH